MRRVSAFILPALIFVLAALFGISKRSTYTNIQNENGYQEKLMVAEIPAAGAEKWLKNMELELKAAPYVMRVQPVREIEYMFMTARQRVRVEKVVKGDLSLEGKEIYLVSSHWSLSLNTEPYSLECGFVNILKKGEIYLVFVMGQVNGVKEDIPVYRVCEDTIITPAFCYGDKAQVILPTDGESTYVSYSPLKDNEFFAESPEGMDAWERLKTEVMEEYE